MTIERKQFRQFVIRACIAYIKAQTHHDVNNVTLDYMSCDQIDNQLRAYNYEFACDSNDKHIEIAIGVFMRDDTIELIYEHANENCIYDIDE